jgi:hypothetical protein
VCLPKDTREERKEKTYTKSEGEEVELLFRRATAAAVEEKRERRERN